MWGPEGKRTGPDSHLVRHRRTGAAGIKRCGTRPSSRPRRTSTMRSQRRPCGCGASTAMPTGPTRRRSAPVTWDAVPAVRAPLAEADPTTHRAGVRSRAQCRRCLPTTPRAARSSVTTRATRRGSLSVRPTLRFRPAHAFTKFLLDSTPGAAHRQRQLAGGGLHAGNVGRGAGQRPPAGHHRSQLVRLPALLKPCYLAEARNGAPFPGGV